ncbi:hypothetical protein HDV00_007044 [Rhizophlyctis rosea]|nr:hypothetical protein HDV00_007044 [Rhizophlyctis rosea]
MDTFPHRLLHTQNYRKRDAFVAKRIIVVGGASSGIDITRDIAPVANGVYLSLQDPNSVGDIGESLDSLTSSSPSNSNTPISNITKKGTISRFHQDGNVEFDDGTIAERIDAVIFATGYLYDFPFLNPEELSGGEWMFGASLSQDDRAVESESKDVDRKVLTTDGFGVHNLYKLIFYIPNPTLAFVGLPLKVCPFPLFEFQSQFICHTYLNPKTLPPPHILRSQPTFTSTSSDSISQPPEGSKASMVLGHPTQYEYWNWIAEGLGVEGVGKEREDIRKEVLVMRKKVLGY